MTELKTLDDIDVEGRTVLVRADLNVPMEELELLDGLRIERLIPTLSELLTRGAKVVLLSHFGRPEGKFDPALSLRRVNEVIGAALERPPLPFAENCIGPDAKSVIDDLEPGEIALFENLRFHPGETANDPEFAKQLAALGDIFVNDAFSCAHRAHASVEAIAHILPSVAGRGMVAELEALYSVLHDPQRPLAALIGGAKVSSKLALVSNLIEKVEVLAIGGAMANTFLRAKGIEVGKSLFEPTLVDTAGEILAMAEAAKCHIILPEYVVVASALNSGAKTHIVPVERIPPDQMILDIAERSARRLARRLRRCKTIVWNGPLGAFETKPFDRATNWVASRVAKWTQAGNMISVAGGGDTMAALANAGAADGFSYISAAGGAFLEWLEGKRLPGVEVLLKSEDWPQAA